MVSLSERNSEREYAGDFMGKKGTSAIRQEIKGKSTWNVSRELNKDYDVIHAT